jgi:MoaA/NifB/PqqE/SkfB family radical SAM enzyme
VSVLSMGELTLERLSFVERGGDGSWGTLSTKMCYYLRYCRQTERGRNHVIRTDFTFTLVPTCIIKDE